MMSGYKSSGRDRLLPQVSREMKVQVGLCLAKTFNTSSEYVMAPLDARLTPINLDKKKEDRTCATNYLPINLTSVLRKVLIV